MNREKLKTFLNTIKAKNILTESILNAYDIIYEAISVDLNPKANGTINSRPDLMRGISLYKPNTEWFNTTLPQNLVNKALTSQLGYRTGIFPQAGRTVLEHDPHSVETSQYSTQTST